jgi:plastocyanin
MKFFFAIAAAALAAAVPAASQPTNVVPVQLYSYGFTPSPIVLRAGQQTTLVFTNAAGKGHEFKAPGFFRAAKLVSGSVDDEGSIELQPHQSASITLIPARGTYRVHCGHFMHDQLGMHTFIYVQ